MLRVHETFTQTPLASLSPIIIIEVWTIYSSFVLILQKDYHTKWTSHIWITLSSTDWWKGNITFLSNHNLRQKHNLWWSLSYTQCTCLSTWEMQVKGWSSSAVGEGREETRSSVTDWSNQLWLTHRFRTGRDTVTRFWSFIRQAGDTSLDNGDAPHVALLLI